jgi:cytochrome b6-f complex iron-sulfur subunit
MSEDVQERVEDYLALDQFIQQLHSQESAHLPANLASQQRHIYSMAVLFHTASPPLADPSPEFRGQLRQRLLEQMRDDNDGGGTGGGGENSTPTTPSQGQKQFRSIYQPSQPPQPPSPHPTSKDAKQHKTIKRGQRRIPLSRRTLFTGGTVAAASLLGAAAIGGAIEHSLEKPPSDPNPSLPGDVWHPVTTVQQLGTDPVLFTTNTISGYVIRQTEDTSDEQKIIAFSAACTHLGCTVQWQEDERQFPCPCHGRIFDTTGGPVNTPNSLHHNTWLPRMETKTEADGTIYVKVPLPLTHRNGKH